MTFRLSLLLGLTTIATAPALAAPAGGRGLPPAVGRLTEKLLDLEEASSEARLQVREWLSQGAENIVTSEPGQARQGKDSLTAGFLAWLPGLPPSRESTDWKLSRIARGERGSCLGLVCVAVLVGRSLGLRVDPVAVPDHLLLRVELDSRVRLLELLDGAREIPSTLAPGRYRVPRPPASAFLRPLSDDELLACVRIERGAESIEAKNHRAASRDFRVAARDYPDHPSGFYNLSLVEAERERWTRAERLLSRAIVLNPLDPRPWHNRALVRWKSGRSREAIQDLNEALRLDPGFAAARDLQRIIIAGSAE